MQRWRLELEMQVRAFRWKDEETRLLMRGTAWMRVHKCSFYRNGWLQENDRWQHMSLPLNIQTGLGASERPRTHVPHILVRQLYSRTFAGRFLSLNNDFYSHVFRNQNPIPTSSGSGSFHTWPATWGFHISWIDNFLQDPPVPWIFFMKLIALSGKRAFADYRKNDALIMYSLQVREVKKWR